MNLKSLSIRKSDCKFYVDKEKRTIVCVIPNTRVIFSNFVTDNFDYKDFEVCIYGDTYPEIMYMPNSFYGKAVCSEEDEWNEETGRNLAYYRARTKLYRSFFRQAQLYLNKIDHALDDMIDQFNTLGGKIGVWQTHLADSLEIKKEGED